MTKKIQRYILGKETTNKKHLFWLIPLLLLSGFVAGTQVGNAAYKTAVDAMISCTVTYNAQTRAVMDCSSKEQSMCISFTTWKNEISFWERVANVSSSEGARK